MTGTDGRLRRRTLLGHALALAAAGPWPAFAGAANPIVLVLAHEGTRLLSLDAVDLRVRRTLALPAGRWRQLFVQNGGHALLVAEDGAVARIAPDAAALLAHSPGLGTLTDAALGDGGRLPLLATQAPAALTLLDATSLQPIKRWPLATVDGRAGVAGAEVHDAPPRRSFVVAPADLPELWEISYDPRAEDQYEGLVHDFRMGEGVPVRGHLHARRTRLPQPLRRLALDDAGLLVIGAAPDGALHGYNLDARRRAATWAAGGAPNPRGGAWVRRGAQTWLALPDTAQPLLHWLHPEGATPPAPLALPAPARWLRADQAAPVLWAAAGETLLRIDTEGGGSEAVLRAGAVLDLQFLPGGQAACVLTGGQQPTLYRIDAASARVQSQRVIDAAIAMALDLRTGPSGPA